MHYHTEAIYWSLYRLDCGVIDIYEGEDGQELEYCGIIQNIHYKVLASLLCTFYYEISSTKVY
jgi:hypothetical protein